MQGMVVLKKFEKVSLININKMQIGRNDTYLIHAKESCK